MTRPTGPSRGKVAVVAMADESGPPSLVDRLSRTIQERPDLRSLAIVGLFLMAFVAVLYVASAVFVPLTLAFMLSFVFRPIVAGFGRIGIPRAVSAALVMATLVGGAGYGAVSLAEPAMEWMNNVPTALRKLETKARKLRDPVKDVTQIAEQVERITQGKKSTAPATRTVQVDKPSLLERVVSAAGKTLGGAVVMIIGLFFMLIWGDQLLSRLMAFLPDYAAPGATTGVMEKIERDMSSYLGTVTIINVALGAAVGAALYALGMPNPVLWGVLAGIVNFVPYVGAAVGVGAVALASVVAFDQLGAIVLPPLAYLTITAVEGQVVTPLVIGRTFRVSPLVVFMWLVFWAWLWGIAGALVAVPLLVLVKITCEHSQTLKPIADLIGR